MKTNCPFSRIVFHAQPIIVLIIKHSFNFNSITNRFDRLVIRPISSGHNSFPLIVRKLNISFWIVSNLCKCKICQKIFKLYISSKVYLNIIGKVWRIFCTCYNLLTSFANGMKNQTLWTDAQRCRESFSLKFNKPT